MKTTSPGCDISSRAGNRRPGFRFWRAAMAVCLLALALHIPHPALAQSAVPGISATLRLAQPRNAQVGDPIRLLLEVYAPRGTDNLTMPQVADSLGPALYCLERGKVKKTADGGKTLYQQEITVAGYDSGALTIPPLKGFASAPGGQTTTFTTDSILLSVATVDVDTTQPIRPIKDVIAPQESFLERYGWYMLAALLLAVLGVLAIWLLRRKKPAPVPAPVPAAPPESAAALALRSLDALERESIWQRGDVKEYYVRLSGIVRSFIRARHGVDAPEMTTDELLVAVRRHPALKEFSGMLADILQPADMAKFARAQMQPHDHQCAIDSARTIVRAAVPPADHPPAQPAP